MPLLFTLCMCHYFKAEHAQPMPCACIRVQWLVMKQSGFNPHLYTWIYLGQNQIWPRLIIGPCKRFLIAFRFFVACLCLFVMYLRTVCSSFCFSGLFLAGFFGFIVCCLSGGLCHMFAIASTLEVWRMASSPGVVGVVLANGACSDLSGVMWLKRWGTMHVW